MLTRLFLSALLALVAVMAMYYVIRNAAKEKSAPIFDAELQKYRRWQRYHKNTLNRWRQMSGMIPLWPSPYSRSEAEDAIPRGRELYRALCRSLRNNPYIERQEKKTLYLQIRETLDNIVELTWTLFRVEYVASLLTEDAAAKQDMLAIQQHLGEAVINALKVLENFQVGLLKLELADEEKTSGELIKDLKKANLHMRDLAQAHETINLGDETL